MTASWYDDCRRQLPNPTTGGMNWLAGRGTDVANLWRQFRFLANWNLWQRCRQDGVCHESWSLQVYENSICTEKCARDVLTRDGHHLKFERIAICHPVYWRNYQLLRDPGGTSITNWTNGSSTERCMSGEETEKCYIFSKTISYLDHLNATRTPQLAQMTTEAIALLETQTPVSEPRSFCGFYSVFRRFGSPPRWTRNWRKRSHRNSNLTFRNTVR